MPVEAHLEPNEVVIASSGFFYATDRRLLRFEPAPLFGPQAESLAYGDIQSVAPRVQSRYRLMAVSLTVFVLGLVDPARIAGTTKLILMLAGLGGLVYAIMSRKTMWVFASSQVGAAARDRWRLVDDGNERTRRLVQTVQSRLGHPQAESPAPEHDPNEAREARTTKPEDPA